MQRLLLSLLTLLVATGTDALADDLQLTQIHPSWGVESLSTEIEVIGANFTESTEVALVGGGAYFVSQTRDDIYFDVVVVNGTAYTVGGLGLKVYDVTDPWSPRLLSSLARPRGWAIDIAGDHIYIVGDGELSIVDVADLFYPRFVGTVSSCRGSWQDIDTTESLAVVACGTQGGIGTFDVTDPNHPRALGSLQFPNDDVNDNYAVVVRNDVAFVTDRSMGLVAVDISEPTTPAILSTAEPGDFWSRDLEVVGDYAYITAEHLGVQVFDIRNPTKIALVGQALPTRNAYSIGVFNGFAFVFDSGILGIDVYDVRDPHDPLSSYAVVNPHGVSLSFNIDVVDGFVYVANFHYGGLDIYDVRVSAAPGIVGQVQEPGRATDVAIRGEHAYVAGGHGGLQIFDVSEPTTDPVLLGLTEDADATRVVLRCDLAYVVDWYYGFHIIDVGMPDAPRVTGSLETADYVNALAVREPFAYLDQDWTNELIVVDASDITNPTPVTALSMDARIRGLTIADDWLYVANSWAGLVIMDLSDPRQPMPIATLQTPGRVSGVAISGDLAFLADGPGGFHSVDISDPFSPRIIGTLQSGIEANGVTISGTTAYVSSRLGGDTRFGGMLVIDVSEPTTPRLAGGSDHLGRPMAVSGEFGYMPSGSRGLRVFRLPPVQEAFVLGPDRVSIQVPSGMNVGTYHALGLDPSGQSDILRNAFTVLPDGDGDGVPTGDDCDDQNAAVYPGAVDLPGNTVDENCDGILVCDPASDWKNRGEFVSCIAQECARLRNSSLVSGQECGELISDARRPVVGQY